MENFVQQWFKQAREELQMAEYLLKGNYFTEACYHGHQSVEKAIKGAPSFKRMGVRENS